MSFCHCEAPRLVATRQKHASCENQTVLLKSTTITSHICITPTHERSASTNPCRQTHSSPATAPLPSANDSSCQPTGRNTDGICPKSSVVYTCKNETRKQHANGAQPCQTKHLYKITGIRLATANRASLLTAQRCRTHATISKSSIE
jgi:hypothetical protein